ncbi:MAG TPA: deoxyribose-phosphate aldolase [Terriglobales bacterium]|jgi:deoxyribose-phosphate aldolase
MTYTYEAVAKMIDHSLLNPSLTRDELEAGCELAVKYDVASVCILPYYVARCAEILRGGAVQPSTTIGFPHGGHATAIKLAEARQAMSDGATELDMVVNISRVRSSEWDAVRDEIRSLTEVTHQGGAKIKVIFENAYLDDETKIRLCEICGEAGADWVKTSTGYAASGATMEDLALMRKHSPPHVQVKAAGGVRDLDALLAVRALGVTRVGATRTATMLDEARIRLGLTPLGISATVPAGY